MINEQFTIMTGFTIFILALFLGYYVVWRVTPALHAPLMAMTNVISSIIIIGGLLAANLASNNLVMYLADTAVFLATINIVGGLTITYRMLKMFDKNKK